MDDINFGEWLSRHRKSLGLTQKQLAKQIDCATITLRKIEAGQRHPSIQVIKLIARFFAIPANELDSFIHFARGEKLSTSYHQIGGTPGYLSNTNFQLFLPTPLTTLIGREKEVSIIERVLLDGNFRLITLIGPPGIGKTRLGTEVARELIPYFSGMVGFINLSLLEKPDQIALTILQSIGVSKFKLDAPVDQVKADIGDQNMLLLLDNLEHLLDYASPIIYDLLQACPHLKMIVTSREALHIAGEQIFVVPPLDLLPKKQLQDMNPAAALQYSAIKLFAERAGAVRVGFKLTQNNIEDVAAICEQLDGMPLAIELLAARINLMPPRELLSHLNDHLILHTNGAAYLPIHHKSLYHAINWSFSFLSAEEQRLFDNLSVFSGGFTLDEIEEAFIDDSSHAKVNDLLGSLVEKSLIQSEVDQYGEQRFNMLTIIRQFASEKLAESGEEVLANQRHLAYFLKFSQSAYRDVQGQDKDKWIERLEIEQNNLRSALNWCISTQNLSSALNLLTVLNLLWSYHGNDSEISCWFGMLQSLPDFHDHLSGNDDLLAQFERINGGASSYRNAESILSNS